MMRDSSLLIVAAVLFCLTFSTSSGRAGGSMADFERAGRMGEQVRRLYHGPGVEAFWSKDGKQVWVRTRLEPRGCVFQAVDLATGALRPAFDHTKLAAALGQAAKQPARPDDLPISTITPGREVFQFRSGDSWWTCQLPGLELSPLEAPPEKSDLRAPEDGPRRTQGGGGAVNLVFQNKTSGEVRVFWLDFQGKRQPYGTIPSGERHGLSTYQGHVWLVTDANEAPLGVVAAPDSDSVVAVTGRIAPAPRPPRPARGGSPDGKYQTFVREDNLFLRRVADRKEIRLSMDGKPGEGYDEGSVRWAPDSRTLAVLRVKRPEPRLVTLVESSPSDQVQPKVHQIAYPKPGDPIDEPRVRLFDVASAKPVPVEDTLCPTPWSLDEFNWLADGTEFSFLYNQRGHQVERVVAFNARNGQGRVILEETSKTFIDYSQKTFFRRLPKTREILWASERDGWNHLYLIDESTGKVKNQVTKGNWNVRSVVTVDEEKRRILIRAVGVRPGQDPYYVHWCRVNFDGSGFVVLTESDGTHQIEFSPDGSHFLDTWSRIDHPPEVELRQAETGKLVAVLGKTDDGALRRTGWTPPEPFAAKGRDGRTDIHGIICKPSNFDAGKKYPVIEEIYAGPHDAFVPKGFSPWHDVQTMAELGFVVVQIDGMGTNWRGREFHDVCYKNLKDAGFPDRIAWMKAAAATRPWMDLERVGIYGGSAGGQNALGGLLFHPEFYKVGVADCGCHDNRMDKIWWNEAWMGWPVDASYADNSNVTHAGNLTGNLLLFVGELDHNVDPSSTMQVVNALEKANKDFDLIVMTGSDHGSAESPYGRRRRADFFVRHLLGVEPRQAEK